ncbi:hypothetical protein GCM10009674_10770 [Nesterenkonia xinjiangensis]
MPIPPEEIDAADALVRERVTITPFWEVASWPGLSTLAEWSSDPSVAQVDHLSESEAVVISVRTAHHQDSTRVLKRMHARSLMQRGDVPYQETRVGIPEASRATTLSVDGQYFEAQHWADADSWWLAVDLTDGTAVVVGGAIQMPVARELRAVTEIEPLLTARRERLLRHQD